MPLFNIVFLLPLGLALLCSLSGCAGPAFSKPFAWPGLDVQHRKLMDSPNQSVLLAITHAELVPAHRAVFDDAANRVLAVLPQQPGLVGYSVRSRILGNEVWTATVWTDEAAMTAFVRSPEHTAAVRDGAVAVKTIQYQRVRLPVSALPLNWDRLLHELAKAPPAQPISTS